MEIIITTKRYVYIGLDQNGKRILGTLGDTFSVPKDFSQKTAFKILRSGIGKVVKEVKETATDAVKETAVKAAPLRRSANLRKKRRPTAKKKR